MGIPRGLRSSNRRRCRASAVGRSAAPTSWSSGWGGTSTDRPEKWLHGAFSPSFRSAASAKLIHPDGVLLDDADQKDDADDAVMPRSVLLIMSAVAAPHTAGLEW